jgi:hypothetical protein
MGDANDGGGRSLGVWRGHGSSSLRARGCGWLVTALIGAVTTRPVCRHRARTRRGRAGRATRRPRRGSRRFRVTSPRLPRRRPQAHVRRSPTRAAFHHPRPRVIARRWRARRGHAATLPPRRTARNVDGRGGRASTCVTARRPIRRRGGNLSGWPRRHHRRAARARSRRPRRSLGCATSPRQYHA